jgi:hypothetical protein
MTAAQAYRISAVSDSEEEYIGQPFYHGWGFGGNKLICGMALTALKAERDENGGGAARVRRVVRTVRASGKHTLCLLRLPFACPLSCSAHWTDDQIPLLRPMDGTGPKGYAGEHGRWRLDQLKMSGLQWPTARDGVEPR